MEIGIGIIGAIFGFFLGFCMNKEPKEIKYESIFPEEDKVKKLKTDMEFLIDDLQRQIGAKDIDYSPFRYHSFRFRTPEFYHSIHDKFEGLVKRFEEASGNSRKKFEALEKFLGIEFIHTVEETTTKAITEYRKIKK